MGFIPTHGPNCEKAVSYLTHCNICYKAVVYIQCSCRRPSKVYLDPPAQGPHDCDRAMRGDRAKLLMDLIKYSQSDPKGDTECPMCNKFILNVNDRIRKHFKKCPNRKEWFPR